MHIFEIAEKVNGFFKEVMKQNCRILTIIPKEKDWEVLCEVNIDPQYTAIRGMGDIVEIYEVVMNSSMEIISFSRIETKRKAALDNEM
jgi:hypothetical protein